MSLDLSVSLVSCTIATWMFSVVNKCISSEALLFMPLMLIWHMLKSPVSLLGGGGGGGGGECGGGECGGGEGGGVGGGGGGVAGDGGEGGRAGC